MRGLRDITKSEDRNRTCGTETSALTGLSYLPQGKRGIRTPDRMYLVIETPLKVSISRFETNTILRGYTETLIRSFTKSSPSFFGYF